jgi:tetratricopeptide (TPR) repeat protein
MRRGSGSKKWRVTSGPSHGALRVNEWRVLFMSAMLLVAVGAWAQDPAVPNGGKPGDGPGQSAQPAPPGDEPAGAAPAPAPAKLKKKGEKDKDTATSNAPDQPMWDPLRAEKDIEVGRHYMSMGDVDAAIDRFQDATTAKPGYALPFLYLGEAQEKKGQKRLAAKSYTKYLDLDPHAGDAGKIRKKIDKLYKELETANK